MGWGETRARGRPVVGEGGWAWVKRVRARRSLPFAKKTRRRSHTPRPRARDPTHAQLAQLTPCSRPLSPLPRVVWCGRAVTHRKSHPPRPPSLLTPTLHPVLLGPVQALTYAFNYGAPSSVLGAAWVRRVPWPVALSAGAAARVAGVAAYVALSSWTLGEELLQLLLANVCALLVRE